MKLPSHVDIIIIGAGAAGLAAAHELSRAGKKVCVLEARPRLGGRAWTKPLANSDAFIEYGAEFIHGTNAESWKFIQESGLRTREILRDIRIYDNGFLPADESYWPQVQNTLKALFRYAEPDIPVAEALAKARQDKISPEALDQVARLVQGYHAGDLSKMSIMSLQKIEEESNDEGSHRNFVLTYGYCALFDWLANSIHSYAGCQIIYPKAVVTKVQWERGKVLVSAHTKDGLLELSAHKLLTSIPLGVWKTATGQKGHIEFSPPLKHRDSLLAGLEMGNVLKVVFEVDLSAAHQFETCSVLSKDEFFSFWWFRKHQNKMLAIGWTGGPSAGALSKRGDDAVIATARAALEKILGVTEKTTEHPIGAAYFHDWLKDPYARGAYSYIAAGGLDAQKELAMPIDDTLYFAGEMIPPHGEPGTIHGAMASGLAAARAILTGFNSSFQS